MSAPMEWTLFVFFLIASAFYSGMETGIVSINRVRLRHLSKRRDKRALQLEKWILDPDGMLATSLVGTNLSNTAFTVIGTRLIVDVIGSARIGGPIAAIILTLLILIFGEYLPKAWYQSHPLIRSARFVPLFRFSQFLFHWVSVPVIALVRTVIPPPAENEGEENQTRITRRDIQFLLSRESGATPDLSEQRRRMVVGVFGLSEQNARDIMVPREKMLQIKPTTPMPEILELAAKSKVKSLPVYSETEKRFTGILKLSDLFEHIDEEDLRVPDLIRPPQYVDEEMPADDLIPRMRLTRQPMLLVRDDQGIVTGFVTTEVVLEEIVGPLYDR
ncbi:CNNM domain-containing protein [Kiritimatiellaeota bacterium B1221]|nr:CNNM domain-containing protein [Kiritimatiellaeota bacterium B1221]